MVRLSLIVWSIRASSFCFVNVLIQSEQPRELTQIQYLAWPDHGVPDDSTDFLDLVALVRTKRAGQDQPVVVHCRWASVCSGTTLSSVRTRVIPLCWSLPAPGSVGPEF